MRISVFLYAILIPALKSFFDLMPSRVREKKRAARGHAAVPLDAATPAAAILQPRQPPKSVIQSLFSMSCVV